MITPEIRVLDPFEAGEQLDEITDLYLTVYSEPPYSETADDAADFRDRQFPNRAQRDGFRMVTARAGEELVGFVFGHTLPADTGWWSGLLEPAPPEFTKETGDRSYAVIELVVRPDWRRRGVAAAMMKALLADRPEERAVLLVRPDAPAAVATYAAWGWRRVGPLRPWDFRFSNLNRCLPGGDLGLRVLLRFRLDGRDIHRGLLSCRLLSHWRLRWAGLVRCADSYSHEEGHESGNDWNGDPGPAASGPCRRACGSGLALRRTFRVGCAPPGRRAPLRFDHDAPLHTGAVTAPSPSVSEQGGRVLQSA
jgi:ribosomal protein S18 acetylase RimI-like enzyme